MVWKGAIDGPTREDYFPDVEVPGPFGPVSVIHLMHYGRLVHTILHRRLENENDDNLSARIWSISFLHRNNQKAYTVKIKLSAE